MKIRVATGNGTHTRIKNNLHVHGWHIIADNQYIAYSIDSLAEVLGSYTESMYSYVIYTVTSIVGNTVSLTTQTAPSKMRTY